MVKTLMLSIGSLSLAAYGAASFGLQQGKPGLRQAPKAARSCAAAEQATTCCAASELPATITCDSDACVIRFTTADGRAGVIELTCADGECKVKSCSPCDAGDCCPAPADADCCKDDCARPGACVEPGGKGICAGATKE